MVSAGDWASVMLACGADVVVTSSSGARVVAIEDFLVDMFATSCQPNELVTEVRVKTHSQRGGGNYLIRDAGDSNCREACVERQVWRSFAGDKDYMENYFDAYVHDICILTSTVVAARSFLEEVGMFRLGQMWAQDTDLFWRMAYRQPKLGYLIQPIAVYSRDLPTSITMLNKGRIQQRCDLIERHLKMAAKHGRSESFRPCALKLLTRWLRGCLDQPDVDISQILDRFDDILPRNLKIEMRMRIASPRLAGCLFKCYFAAKKPFLPGKGGK